LVFGVLSCHQSSNSFIVIGVMCHFLDDLTLGGLATTVAEDIKKGRQLGFELNASKCAIVCNILHTVEKFKIFGEFKTVQLSNLTLLGLPVHSGPAENAVLESKCEDLARAVSRLALLHAHDALVILRNSLSVPKLRYLLQTAECSGRPAPLQFDNILRDHWSL